MIFVSGMLDFELAVGISKIFDGFVDLMVSTVQILTSISRKSREEKI